MVSGSRIPFMHPPVQNDCESWTKRRCCTLRGYLNLTCCDSGGRGCQRPILLVTSISWGYLHVSVSLGLSSSLFHKLRHSRTLSSCIPDSSQELYINGRLGFTKQETSHVSHRIILFYKVMKGQQKHSTAATGLVKLQVSGCEGRLTGAATPQVLHGRTKSLIALRPAPNRTERLQGGCHAPRR